jgi:hypothetical protein
VSLVGPVGSWPSVLALVVLALAHAALGTSQGLEDGDVSLLWFDALFIVPTLAAAALCASRRRVPAIVAQLLTVLVLALALVTLPLHLLGLFHLPQAAIASVVAFRAAGR